MLRFLTDIDNTISATDVAMRAVVSEATQGRVNLQYEDVKNYNYHECQDSQGQSITKEEWCKVHDLFSTPRYLWQTQPLPYSIQALHYLASRGKLHVATSRLPVAATRRATIEWLEHYRAPVHDMHFVSHGQKHNLVRDLTVAFEDDYNQAVSFAEVGVPCFLIRHPWNSNRPEVDGVQWVSDWKEAIEKVTLLLGDRRA